MSRPGVRLVVGAGVDPQRVQEFRETFFNVYGAELMEEGYFLSIELKSNTERNTPHDTLYRRTNELITIVQPVSPFEGRGHVAAQKVVTSLFANGDWLCPEDMTPEFSAHETMLVDTYARPLADMLRWGPVSELVDGNALLMLSPAMGAQMEMRSDLNTLLNDVFSNDGAMANMWHVVSAPLFNASVNFAALVYAVRAVYLSSNEHADASGMQRAFKAELGRFLRLVNPAYGTPFADTQPDGDPFIAEMLRASTAKIELETRNFPHYAVRAMATGVQTQRIVAHEELEAYTRPLPALHGFCINDVLRAVSCIGAERISWAQNVALFTARALLLPPRLQEPILQALVWHAAHPVDPDVDVEVRDAMLSELPWYLRSSTCAWSDNDLWLFGVGNVYADFTREQLLYLDGWRVGDRYNIFLSHGEATELHSRVGNTGAIWSKLRELNGHGAVQLHILFEAILNGWNRDFVDRLLRQEEFSPLEDIPTNLFEERQTILNHVPGLSEAVSSVARLPMSKMKSASYNTIVAFARVANAVLNLESPHVPLFADRAAALDPQNAVNVAWETIVLLLAALLDTSQ